MPEFGAKPPQDFEWQMGKTAASIRFVGEAADYAALSADSNEAEKLNEAIEKVKSGEVVLTEFLTPQEYLRDPQF